jgi:hypothetical protein
MYICPLKIRNSRNWGYGLIDVCVNLKIRAAHAMERVFSLFRKELWILEEVNEKTHIKNAVLFVGRAPEREYISRLLFKECKHQFIGHRWLWQVLFPKGKIDKNCSFSIIQTNWPVSRYFRSRRTFCVPTWVYGSVEINSEFAIHLRKNKSVKNILRKIEKKHYEVEISSDPLLFEEFYYKMYQPYINKRYGKCAIDMSYSRLKGQFFNGCEILFVLKESQRIAGTMICYRENETVLYELGVRNGDFHWVEQGAISALYLNAINHCRSKGIKKLSLGGSRPFFSDGVLSYKLTNWNMKINDYSKTFYFLFKQHISNKFTEDFLNNNPFVSLKNGEMVVNTFVSKNSKEDSLKNAMKSKIVNSGLSRVDVHYF